MNTLKETSLFLVCAIIAGSIAWGYSWFEEPLHTAEPWVYAVISRTNIVAVSGPSQVFFRSPDDTFVLYDWVEDEFFAPKPYSGPLELPTRDDINKVLGAKLKDDIAANLSYSGFTLEWFSSHYERYGGARSENSLKTIIEEPRRRIRAYVTWNGAGGINDYYEETFRKKPRLSIVYYSNGLPRKIKHFNNSEKINGGAYEFFPNGRIQTYSHFFEGVPWGPYLNWDEEGNLIKEDFMTGIDQ